MPLQIIGAGLSRTGTLSLHHALEKLGYPTHHVIMVRDDPDQDYNVWVRAFDNPEDHEDEWEKVYGKYSAAIDHPTSGFYKELSARYPDAKVILTVRSAESWFRSMHQTVIPQVAKSNSGLTQATKILQNMFKHTMLNGWMEKDMTKINDKEFLCRYFNDHIEEVKRTIPADRLLVYELGSGWEPLCKFLGKEIPDEPYPRTNDVESFKKTFENFN
ncbi:P-loop containing nucleoside triphosphate hydrolase protein [Chlamydoabsidia padenii]|nr:P-loop containing nucleoside triphosphate hydrolase protein [Chlamydoabsidia padenii]